MKKDDDKLEAAYCAAYMDFLAKGKTERRCYAAAIELLTKAGFKELSTLKTLKPGDRVWRGYHAKTLMACVIGQTPSAAGIRVVGGHTDAPRLDLKPRPVYEKGGLVYFDTHVYGGIKKYQWLVLPLALYGVIVKTDGTVVEVAVGDEPGDPVFLISDILPHLGKDQEKKTQKEFFPAEDLDVVAGLGERAALVKLLGAKYGVTEEDLLSAELEIVPAGGPREVGLDRALIAAYGHDDRVCAYAGLSALVDIARAKTPPARTCACILCDKEEIGSEGASGMASSFFENTVAELIEREGRGGARDIDVRRALEASTMLSADVTAAADPHFPDVDSTGNEARLGKGPAASKYTGGATKAGASDCRAEFVAEIRRLMAKGEVDWQMAELGRQEKGGGGTIAKFMARFGMDVLDFGTPLLNMHAPWELAAKHDCYHTKKAYAAFLRG
ncbi:MAG: aminopeptidase [bacterium]|nr:aminopeptidase [bacterium]